MHHSKGVGRNDQAAAGLSRYLGHSLFDIGFSADGSCLDLQRPRRRNGLERTQEDGVVRRGLRIEQDGKAMSARCQLLE